MNDDSRRFSYELSRIPCPLCRSNMRLKLSLRLLMSQFKHLCEHCKGKVSYIDKRCVCKEKSTSPTKRLTSIDQEEHELYKRIKNFYKSIVPSPRLAHKTKILPLLDEYNPFQSLSVPSFGEYDTRGRQMKLADSEPNLSYLERQKNDPYRKYDGVDDGRKSDRDYGAERDRVYGPDQDAETLETTPGGRSKLTKEKYGGMDTSEKDAVDGDDEKIKYPEKGKGVSEGKEKTDRGGEKSNNAEKGKAPSAGKEKNVDREKDAVEGKVKKSKDTVKEKLTDGENKAAEGKGKKGKDEKMKYAEKGFGVFVSKVKKDNVDKEQDDDEGQGKKLTYSKKAIKSQKDKDQINLDILSFSERRELERRKGETHKKKPSPKKKKHDDQKDEEPQKKSKSHRSDEEQESKVKKKDADVDYDLATPLTYTETTERVARNPFLKKGSKKSKKKPRKSIGKISAESIEKIITPKVRPKILDLIKKLIKTPRTRDKYYERISSRTSRYLQFEDVCYTSTKSSFLELLNKPSPRKFHSCIVGNKIIKYKLPMPKFSEVEEISSISVKPRIYVKYEEKPAQIGKDRMKIGDDTNSLTDLGVLCYSLSDRSFISKGYTILPTEKILRKLNVYRMRPSNPHNNWFARNRRKKRITYGSGQTLAVFEGDERCRIYYKNGNVALDYYQAEDSQAKERIVLYSDGENELKQKVPVSVLATFDHMGTGIIYDMKGNVRAKYNQNEGVILDKAFGPYSKWKWHKLNDPPVLEEVMMDTTLPDKDPRILRMRSQEQLPRQVDEKILEIEHQNSLKEKGKKMFKSFKPFPIKMKALKINDQFTLHIVDQAKIYLTFRDGPTSFRIDVGMILDCNEIIDMETMEMGEVDVPIERKPARSTSLHTLQRTVEHSRLLERNRRARSQRQRPAVEPCRSLDRVRSLIAPAPRVHLPGTTQTVFPCSCSKNST